MALLILKYFKIKKHGLPLPDPFDLLNQHLSSSAIEEANKEVTAALGDPAKRHPYLKISPEQKAIIAMLLITESLMLLDSFRKTFQDFPENSPKKVQYVDGRRHT